jgi:hypothetical protein
MGLGQGSGTNNYFSWEKQAASSQKPRIISRSSLESIG